MSNRVSQDQIDVLLEFLMGHPNLATGVGLGARSKETVQRQWEILASSLNALGSGSSKTGDRWKKYWNDLKHKAKTRASSRKQDLNITGGGPPNPMGELSETDQKVLAIIGHEAVFGDVEHRVSLFRPQTASVVMEDAQVDVGYQSPVSRSQNETQTEIYVVEEPAGVNINSPSTRGQTDPRAEIAGDNFNSPSTRGQTDPRAGPAVVDLASLPSTSRRLVSPTQRRPAVVDLASVPSTSRRLFSPAQRNSPVSHSRRGRTNTIRSGNQVRADTTWVIELEQRRVQAEEKLANAALIMAEASRVQAEAARSQVEVARMMAESVATLAQYKKNN